MAPSIACSWPVSKAVKRSPKRRASLAAAVPAKLSASARRPLGSLLQRLEASVTFPPERRSTLTEPFTPAAVT